MEERKTAAIVLGILALALLFFTIILPAIRYHGTQTIAFRGCTVKYKYWNSGLVPDIDRVSQNKLALCLCNIYQQKPDTAVRNRIIKIYKQYGKYTRDDSLRFNNNIDSIIKNKYAVLDTLILID